MYRAVLDTCVLLPGLQRDFLLQLAAEEAYAPVWGSGILFELDYVLDEWHARRGVRSSEEIRSHLFTQMSEAFPGAEVIAPKNGAYAYVLNDVDDGHVVHTALLGKADAIVTADTRSGLETCPDIQAAAVEIIHPAAFAASTVWAHPEAGVRAIQALASRRSSPAQTPSAILEHLAQTYGMDGVAELIAPRLP